jgi:hypothetical protein
MDKIRILAGEEWDDSAAAEIAKISRMRYNLEFKPALQT